MKSNITKLNLIVIALFAAWAVQSCTEEKGNSYTSKTKVDAEGLKFIKTAHEAGLVEIEASKIAKKNSANSQVTAFADMMITDHRAMAKDVDSLAEQKFVTVVGHVNHDDRITLDSLAKKTGPEFDKAYMEMMVEGHKEATELFKDNKESNYTAVRKVAFGWYSKLEGHLDEAKKVQSSLK
jgi:putative membrane protein